MSSSARRCWITITFLLSGLAATCTVHAAEMHGRSSTQLLWYNDIVDASSQMDIAEYLRFTITDIDKEKKVSLYGYGRLLWDIKGNDPSGNSDDLQERVYYLYADYKDFLDSADLRVGRQFINLSAGSAHLDGVEAHIKKIGPLGLVVMGGRNVIFGEEGSLTSHSYSAGFSAYLAGKSMDYLDLSYVRTYDYGDIARDIIGSSYKQYFFKSIKVYANARYDLTAEVFNELLGGIKYFPTLNLMMTAEYYQSYPTFDSTSIYSVFAVNQYKENIFRADYTLATWVDVSVGYRQEDFGEDGDATLYDVGLKFRPSVNATIGLFHDSRSGYPGDLDGYRVYTEYRMLRKWNAAAGIDYDSYQRDDMTGQETAKRYWAGGRYTFAKNMSSSFRVQNSVNVNYSKDIQGRLTFDVDF
ncbi:MAG TPA: hypothetical protein DCO77_02600 [Nitrospiraceae bacterium]|nr:hypothetical protein [Nitrospiraceae bacterium]